MTDIAVNSAGTAVPAEQRHNAQSQASFELPEEDTHTALQTNDRRLVVNLRTGEPVPEPIARDRQTDNLVLVCLDPRKKETAQSDAALRVAKKVVSSGDTVILMSVLPLQVLSNAALASFGNVYDGNRQVEILRQMASDRIEELRNLADRFPKDVQIYARVVHGGPERQILLAAEETNCSLIIIGKRKLGTWQKLVTPSVSNWVVSKAPCDVLIAK